MSRKPAGVGIVLVLFAWTGEARGGEDDLALDLGAGGSLELRRIPKGSFTQGSPVTELGREPDETPRSVTITHAFWLGKAPVTRAQFSRFVTETRHVTDAEKSPSGGFGWDPKTGTLLQKKEFTWRSPGFPQKDEDPVVLVTFGDANAFTAWASRKTGRRVRLPAEAEWEYAARGGTTTPWYGASREEDALALGWYRSNGAFSTHPIGLKKANAFGLFDMSGNVQEWCRDIYAPYPSGDAVDPESTTNPTPDPERRVLRGGSWLRETRRSRSAARNRNTPTTRNADNGFRVAADDDVTRPRDDGALLPGVGAIPAADFAPASPVGGSSAHTGGDASAAATAAPARAPGNVNDGVPWLLIAAPAAGAGAVVAWVLARRRPRPTDHPDGITTRAQDDGFWVHAPGVPAGSRLRYACIADGIDMSDVVPLDGGEETFVYTGSRPSAIRIVEVAAAPPPSYRVSRPPTPTGPFMPTPTGPPMQPTSLPAQIARPSKPTSLPTPNPRPSTEGPTTELTAEDAKHPVSMTGPVAPPRVALVDKRESKGPFAIATPDPILAASFVHPTSSPMVTSSPLPSSALISISTPAAPPLSDDDPFDGYPDAY